MAIDLQALPSLAHMATLPWECPARVSQHKAVGRRLRGVGMVAVVAFGGSCGLYSAETVAIAYQSCYPASQLRVVDISEVVGLAQSYGEQDRAEEGWHRQMACVRETLKVTRLQGRRCCEDKAESENMNEDPEGMAGKCLVRWALQRVDLAEVAIAAFPWRGWQNSDPWRRCLVYEAYVLVS